MFPAIMYVFQLEKPKMQKIKNHNIHCEKQAYRSEGVFKTPDYIILLSMSILYEENTHVDEKNISCCFACASVIIAIISIYHSLEIILSISRTTESTVFISIYILVLSACFLLLRNGFEAILILCLRPVIKLKKYAIV